jgi:hypothetical protein
LRRSGFELIASLDPAFSGLAKTAVVKITC